jgi:hypothetical protein
VDTRKQALTKPQKTVGVPQKKGRTEEGKGGVPASPRRRLVPPTLRRQISERWVSRGPRWALRALKPRGPSSAAPFLKTCLKPHALCVSKLSTGSSRAGPTWVQPHCLRFWSSTGNHRRCRGDNGHRALRAALLHLTVLQRTELHVSNTKISEITGNAFFFNTSIHEGFIPHYARISRISRPEYIRILV